MATKPLPMDWTIWLKTQRTRALNLMLAMTAVLGLVGLVPSFVNFLQGRASSFLPYSIVYLLIIILLVTSRLLSGEIRSLGFLVLVFGFGTFALYQGWLASSGRVFLVMMVVAATLFLNPRIGFLSAVLSLLTYALFALAYGEGWLKMHALPDPTTLVPMIIEGVGFTMVVAIVAVSQWFFGQALRAASESNVTSLRSKASFHNIVERSADGMIVINPQGVVLFTNRSAEIFFKRSRADWLGTPSQFTPPPDGSLEIGIQRLNGTSGIAELRLSETEWEDQPAYLAILRDITERKHAETEREGLISQLETKNVELERFTYTVSHDLKSPLVTIMGFLGFLEKDASSGDMEKLKSDISRIFQAATKMQALLSDLLELSRIGRLMNSPVLVPFSEIVDETLGLVNVQIKGRGLLLIVQDNLPVVYGDRARLVEVLQNLIDNAVKFMGNQEKPVIEIGCLEVKRADKPVIFIRDNGIGIDPKFHTHVFGLFNKLDPKSSGTGIGLSLVKRIVEVHGGQIWIESNGAGSGTTFYFTLPDQP